MARAFRIAFDLHDYDDDELAAMALYGRDGGWAVIMHAQVLHNRAVRRRNAPGSGGVTAAAPEVIR